jgi:hypothetical protein
MQRGKKMTLGFARSMFLSLLVGLCAWGFMSQDRARPSPSIPGVADLADLLALPDARVMDVEIGRMNLLCAQGLLGAEDLDMAACLTTLDDMAKRVRSETERHEYRFRQNPAEFEGSDAFFRMLMLMVVLEEDFGVRYNPERVGQAGNATQGDRFFADSRDVFLHGLLGPRHLGTCSSMPVLYVAVGRRLGYPLKLVTTKGHLFVRWEDVREQFNVEATGHGLNRFNDDYYRRWPFAVTDEEVKAEGYLKSLTPAGELAVFLSIRGLCLREAGRNREAADAFATAARLAPNCRSYAVQQAVLAREAAASGERKTTPQLAITKEIKQ